MRAWLVLPLLLVGTQYAVPASAEDAPDVLRSTGLAFLKEAMDGNAAKLVPAASCFARAAELYDAQDKPEKAQETRSCLYWCKKLMPIDVADEFAKGLPKHQKAILNKRAPPSEAQTYFDKAHVFAKANPDQHLLVAIRFFEVADRFKGTDVSLKAQNLSIAAIQKINLAPRAPRMGNPPPTPAGLRPVVPGAKTFQNEIMERAEEEFKAKTGEAKERVVAELDKAIKRMKSRGKENAMLIIEEAKSALGEREISPKVMTGTLGYKIKTYQRVMRSATGRLMKACETVIAGLRRKGAFEEAAQARKRMVGFVSKHADREGRLLLLCDIIVKPSGRMQVVTLAPRIQRLSGGFKPTMGVEKSLVGAQFTRVGWKSTITFDVQVVRDGYLYVVRIPPGQGQGVPASRWEHVPRSVTGAYVSNQHRQWVEKGTTLKLRAYEAALIARTIRPR